MAPSGITFDVRPPKLQADPNRMDIAMFVGFLPLRDGGEAARAAIAAGLASEGWEGRADAALVDVPVRVRSIGEVEALWNTGGRLDRVARVRGLGLEATVTIAPQDQRVMVNLDGQDMPVDLAGPSFTRVQLRDALNAVLTGVDVSLAEPDPNGRAGLIVTRTAPGAGAVTVYANPSLGFPVAQRDQTGVTGCPMGAALRNFFAMGGREAVVVAMGDPVPLFAGEDRLVSALGALVGGSYGNGASTLGDLDGMPIPALPGAYPPRTPWHGLAHLHGLEDVALVLLPDLEELISTVPAVQAVAASPVRPPERFTVCAAEPAILFDGEAAPGAPANASAEGLELWSRLIHWAASETSGITREAMVIAGGPMPAEQRPGVLTDLIESGNAGAGMAHPQLQIAAPWTVSPLVSDMPGKACASDGIIAGAIAAQTLAQGAWRTVAGEEVPHVVTLLGEHPVVTPDTAPALSLLGGTPRGIQILSDRTTDQAQYAQANIRRLMALVLRAARHRGEAAVFEANGPLLWRDVVNSLTGVLRNLHAAGALAGVDESDAFTVECGPETMHQSDIDAGRVIAVVTLRPAHSLEAIEITFVARGSALGVREAA